MARGNGRRKSAPRGMVAQASIEASSIGIGAVVEGITTGVIAVGKATPIVAPIFVALKAARGVVDAAKRHGNELEELHAICVVITEQIIDKCNSTPSGDAPSKIDVNPLTECVKKLRIVAARYSDRSLLSRLAGYRRDGDDIARLRARLERLVSIMGLSASVRISEQVDDVRQLLGMMRAKMDASTLPLPPQQPPVFRGFPLSKRWHALAIGIAITCTVVFSSKKSSRLLL